MNKTVSEILVIRRDNIGDLLCTTPLFTRLREQYPSARITALVNSYNAPALHGNKDIDEVLVYEKQKHRATGQSFWRWLIGRIRVLKLIRSTPYDLVILATPNYSASSMKFALMTRAPQIVGYDLPSTNPRFISVNAAPLGGHEVEAVFKLLTCLGVDPSQIQIPAMSLAPDWLQQEKLRVSLPQKGSNSEVWVGIHISARKPQQRWPVERFAAFAKSLLQSGVTRILIFWAPGTENDSAHPGDDGKAEALMSQLADLPVNFVTTKRLEELIAGVSLCDQFICSDGGAMHVAAALQKPLVCFFGNSDSKRWYPWGVSHELLQPESRDVIDITVAEALAAYQRLQGKLSQNHV